MYPTIEQIPTRYFQPLKSSAFLSLEHTASLKGLFKGKGQDLWMSDCKQLRDQLIQLAREHVLEQVKTYPFALLPIELTLQTTGAGTAFLRWRTKDRTVMGVHLWDELMKNLSVSPHLINDLYAIELQRITLNTQISLVHTVMRRTKECIEKMNHAQAIYQRRMG